MRKPPYTETKDGRQIATPAELKRRRELAWHRDEGLCILCGLWLDIETATTEHIIPRGHGGGTRDDRLDNIAVSHHLGNMARGSQRLEKYLALPLEKRIKNCLGR